MNALPSSTYPMFISLEMMATGRYSYNTDGTACKMRQRNNSKCGRTCAIVLGCVLGACALVAIVVVVWCCLAARRRRDKQSRFEASTAMTAVEEVEYASAHFEVGKEVVLGTCEDERVKKLNAEDLSVPRPVAATAPSNSYAATDDAAPHCHSTVSHSRNPLDSVCMKQEDSTEHCYSPRAPIAEDVVSVMTSQCTGSSVAPSTTVKRMQSSRHSRVRSRNRLMASQVAACPSDSVSSIEDNVE
ncbi:hypothetical protein NESM_000878000 [Novymonas esmeraldas]|uniref:Uncharacterized protein n=1 Tax=Novymonas esmeraldas TaxID=1808958 RepID=A0AAW0EXK5_9TRYP